MKKYINLAVLLLLAASCTHKDILDDATDGISWSVTEFAVSLDEDSPDYPVLSNPGSQTVTYSSSDESVATIDSAGGGITLVSPGNTTITAYAEALGSYAECTAAYVLKVAKHTSSLSWSESTVKVVLEDEDYTFPTLTVTPADLPLSYASSNESVATVSDSGEVTPLAVGSTTISATFAGDENYKSSSASYTLLVVSGSDTGAGTWTYESTGDPGSEDDISNTTFTRMITITWSGGGVTVDGDYYSYVSVDGADVSVANTGGDENIVYKLAGTTSSGSFTIASSKKKQAILLSSVSITNPSGAAINNQSGKRTFVVVEGTNYLGDGSSAAYSSDADMKAVFFSEGQLVFSGGGTLTVEAKNQKEKSCITSDDYVRIMESPTLMLTTGSISAGHGIRGKEYVQLSGGTTVINSAANKKKGIASEGYVDRKSVV